MAITPPWLQNSGERLCPVHFCFLAPGTELITWQMFGKISNSMRRIHLEAFLRRREMGVSHSWTLVSMILSSLPTFSLPLSTWLWSTFTIKSMKKLKDATQVLEKKQNKIVLLSTMKTGDAYKEFIRNLNLFVPYIEKLQEIFFIKYPIKRD